MMTPTPKFKGEILRQVYRVWLLRKFLPVLVLEIVLIFAVLYVLARYVFLQRVIENASSVFFQNPSGIFSFFISAFTSAPVATKIFSIALLALVAILLRQLTQGLLRYILVRENYFGKVKEEKRGL